MSKVLITGGVGFIGRSLTDKLINLGHKVLIVDDLSSGFEKDLNKKAVFLKGSINNLNFLKKTFDYNPKIVVHCAALFANQNSVDNPEKDLLTNGRGILNVLNFWR